MQRFMKVIKAAKRGTGAVGIVLGGSSDSSAAMKKRLKADLPEVSADEISRHESWYRLRGIHLAKRRAEKEVRHGRSRMLYHSTEICELNFFQVPRTSL